MSFDATRFLRWTRRHGQGSLREAGRGVAGTLGRRPARAPKLAMEVLEDRIALATFLVVNSSDGPSPGPAGSLRNAIVQAGQSGSGTDRIIITPRVQGPIDLTAGEIDLDTNLTIENRAGHGVEVRQTTPGARVFQIGSGATNVTIGGRDEGPITIDGGSVNGANGGGILVDGTTDLTLISVELSSNRVAGPGSGGGGIYAAGGTVTLVGSSVSHNQAPDGFGGGISVELGTVVVRDRSHVDDNSSRDIGGIRVHQAPQDVRDAVQVFHGSTVNDNSSTATANAATGDFGGGGIAVQTVGSVFVAGSQVSGNQTRGMYSGGILVTLGDVRVTRGSQIDRNTNQGPGGGIAANFLGSVIVTGHSQVNENTGAALGGGIVNFGTGAQTVTIERGSQVSDNTLTNAESLGGALIVFLETLANGLKSDYQTLTGLTPQESKDLIRQVEAEIAAAHGVDPSVTADRVVAGGAIGTLLGARVQVTGGSRIQGNLSGGRPSTSLPIPVGIGGGVATFLSRVDVDQGTILGNTATEDGGGIWNRRDVRITRSNDSDNNALGMTLGALGGGLFLGSPSRGSLIRSSSIQGNGAEFGGGLYNLGTITVRDTTLARNRATRSGGGIGNRGQLSVLGSTIARNQAAVAGGGISNQGQLTVRRSRIEANMPDNISSS